MPVAVNLPTKIRVHRRALTEHPDWIDEALAAALGRAIANSRKVVLEPRGRYLEVICAQPSFTWSGLSVARELQTDIEGRITAIYTKLLRDSGIADSRSDAPVVLPPDPSEFYDASRGELIGGIYIVDSYGGGTDSVPLQSDGSAFAFDYVPVVKIVRDEVDEQVLGRLHELADIATLDTPRGIIYRTAHGWQVVITNGEDLDQSDPSGLFHFDYFRKFEYLGPTARPIAREVPYVPPPGPSYAEVFDVAAGRAGVKTAIATLLGADFTAWLKSRWSKPPRLTTEKYLAAIADRKDEYIEDFADLIAAKSPTKCIQVVLSGAKLHLWVGQESEPWLKWTGKAELFAIETMEARAKRSGKKSGKGGMAGGDPNAQGAEGGSGGSGKCPADDRPDDHPPDDVEESLEELPFLGEPSLDEIGDAGETLGKKIAALARKLDIAGIKYAGQFCYHAAVAIRDYGEDTQVMTETATGENKAAAHTKGNMGAINFTPDTSPIIARIRLLADAVADLADLMRWVEAIYCSQYYRCSIHGIWRGEGESWSLRFREAVAPVVKEGIGAMFIGACRSMLLQLLATSKSEIQKRQAAMDRYAPLFERWIVPVVAEEADLELMRRMLRNNKYEATALAVGTGIVAPHPGVTEQDWTAANTKLLNALKGGITRQAGQAFEIVQDGGKDKIRDTKGVLWSAEDLEQAIALRGQVAEGADPLVKQFVDTPEAVAKFKTSASIRTTLEDLLKEMVRNNEEMEGKTNGDTTFAFKATGMNEDIPHATIDGGKYALQGIHKTAHEQIGDAFHGSGFYPEGVDDLFDSELGKEALKGAVILVGMVALSVFVPGGAFIAFAAGGALAAHDLSSAYEKKRLYRSLINPDQVLSYAEVELAIFLGWFSAVMAVIPEAGTAAKGLIAGGKAIIKGEAKALGRIAAKAIATRIAESLAEYAVKDLLAAFVKEMVIGLVMQEVIEKAMAPLIEEIEHEASIGHGDAPRAIDEEELAFIAFVNALEEFE